MNVELTLHDLRVIRTALSDSEKLRAEELKKLIEEGFEDTSPAKVLGYELVSLRTVDVKINQAFDCKMTVKK